MRMPSPHFRSDTSSYLPYSVCMPKTLQPFASSPLYSLEQQIYARETVRIPSVSYVAHLASLIDAIFYRHQLLIASLLEDHPNVVNLV